MAISSDRPSRWKADIQASADLFHPWFMGFAPRAYRGTRLETPRQVEQGLLLARDLAAVTPAILKANPGILATLRMATCPPLARDRLIGLSGAGKHLVLNMEAGKLPPKIAGEAAGLHPPIGTSFFLALSCCIPYAAVNTLTQREKGRLTKKKTAAARLSRLPSGVAVRHSRVHLFAIPGASPKPKGAERYDAPGIRPCYHRRAVPWAYMCDGHTEAITIGCATDTKYVMPLAVMLRSLLMHRKEPLPLVVYVLDGGVSEDDKTRLCTSCASDGVEIHWLPLGHASFPGLPLWGGMSPMTYARLLLPELLPESLHKIIWLDSEMIVQGDITALWNAELGDWAALAVQDLVVPHFSSRYGVPRYIELGLAGNAKYFNAGVMVVNLDWWRRNQVAHKVLRYLRDNRQGVYFHDQEGLNVALANHWRELDPRWNQIASVAGRRFLKVRHLDTEKYDEVIHEPFIIHFAGSWKPWTYHNANPSRNLYFHYLDMTAWAGWRPQHTARTVLRGVYESVLRDLLYPVEHLRMLLLHRATRHRST